MQGCSRGQKRGVDDQVRCNRLGSRLLIVAPAANGRFRTGKTEGLTESDQT